MRSDGRQSPAIAMVFDTSLRPKFAGSFRGHKDIVEIVHKLPQWAVSDVHVYQLPLPPYNTLSAGLLYF